MAENMKKREARIQKAGGVIGGVIGIASIVFAMAVVVFSGVSVKLTGTALELSGGIGDRASIPYTEITGVEWRDVFDKGSRTWGTGTGKISSGTFTNDEFGAYRLYLHNRVRCAVVVRHGADETTVFNGVPFPVSWTVKMKKKQKETQDILSYHSQAAGWSDKARAKASGGRQPIEECGRTGL